MTWRRIVALTAFVAVLVHITLRAIRASMRPDLRGEWV